ncbi:hypothetical protein AJ79_08956 [Helicocarpus griseus UAMH5409]|uniref:Uncharacterized protein n=1 Tax=Helicocarpus griseus UAMH5409 TaxID=1447875 RepID=A0A2B7WNK6_9EURO|nr:hypothetical protein AJ79_08956 [Helicocarpus griseus UAMH5409]
MDHMSQAFPPLHDAGPPTSPPLLKCCCGRSECAYLKHNNDALKDLETQLVIAGNIGQDLLRREESYKRDAEKDRSRLLLEMETLQRDKREAQAENARIIEENRDLLEQLEDMNKAITESDAEIKTLTTTLESTQLQVKQLSLSASKVSQLESQIDAMEKEQEELQAKLIVTEEDEKSAVQRWRQAECTLRDLQDQLERIEKESRKEQEKHAELLGRMERRRLVERELDSAAGRLKGAAAASSLGRNKPGTGVVSNFVRDILQDNANLQMGIVELREMLHNSNSEVQNLREQILLHQPLDAEPDEQPPRQKQLSLSEELDAKFPQVASQEFHVHHHYHSATHSISQRKEKVQIPIHRRQRKKRQLLSSALLESPTRHSSRLLPISHRPHGSASSTSTILSQTSVSIPPSTNNRHWSMQSSSSAVAGSISSSMPSSPQSASRTSSIFDRVDHGFDSSRPTSPESNGFASPVIRPYRYHKGCSDIPIRSISGPDESQEMSTAPSGEMTQGHDDTMESSYYSADEAIPPYFHLPIPEEREDITPTEEVSNEQAMQSKHVPDLEPEPEPSSPFQYHQLKRASSHDSLISISGMDIHTLRSRPSQMLSTYSAFSARTPSRIASAGTEVKFTPPVISATNITIPKISLNSGETGHDSRSLLSSVAAAATPPNSLPNNSPLHHPDDVFTTQSTSFSKRVGGWVLGKWGMTPMSSARDMRSSPRSSRRSSLASSSHPPHPPKPPSVSAAFSTSSGSASSTSTATTTKSAAIMPRPPGVNQKGPILGLRPPGKPPTAVQPKVVDEESLQESLLE